MNNEYDNHEEGVVSEAPDIGTLAVLNKSEIDQQVTTAKRYPRSIKKFRDEALQLATLDESTAAECIYALPRDGKTIEGPSARFAEIINYAWGNTRAGARTIGEDGEFVKSQGLFYDLEKNTAISYEVSRRIVNKYGKRFSADMIGTTSNAGSSIALRNAILKGIPKALWKPIYDAARKTVAGDMRTLANRRSEAIKAFQIFGVKQEAILLTLGVKGVEDITLDHLVTLRGLYTAIQEGDTTPEQAFAPPTTASEAAGDATSAKVDSLKDKYAKKSDPFAEEGGTSSNPPEALGTQAPTLVQDQAHREPRRRGRGSSSEDTQGVPLQWNSEKPHSSGEPE